MRRTAESQGSEKLLNAELAWSLSWCAVLVKEILEGGANVEKIGHPWPNN